MENILITGVLGGIGRACAEKLIREGHTVIGIDRDSTGSYMESPAGLEFISADLTDAGSIKGLVSDIVKSFGIIGGFVHCAGFDRMAPLQMIKIEDAESLWRIHALVPICFLSQLIKKKNHSEEFAAVLISSQSAHEGAMGHCAYASAKGAVEGLLAPAAAELMEKGMRINEVCLAPIKTQMSASWMDRLAPSERERLEASYPMGIGRPEDAAQIICFLLSEESRYINGQIIMADGGRQVKKA